MLLAFTKRSLLRRVFSTLKYNDKRVLENIRPDLFYSIVKDVEKYPEFVTSCDNLQITKKYPFSN